MRFDLFRFRSAAMLGCSGAVFSALSLLSPAPSTPDAIEAVAVDIPTAPAPVEVAEVVEVVEALALAPLAVPVGAGEASYYAASLDGRPTASGEPYDHDELTAAHRTLPFGTRLLVRNARNGQEVVVTVNDRGPFIRGRMLDLSGAAARRLGMIKAGTAPVVISRVAQ